jgi:hypothetical protein
VASPLVGWIHTIIVLCSPDDIVCSEWIGKSTAARYLWQQHGAYIIDFDQLARVVVQPGKPVGASIPMSRRYRSVGVCRYAQLACMHRRLFNRHYAIWLLLLAMIF